MSSVLDDDQLEYLQSLRRSLHQMPEISGEEVQTAKRIEQELQRAGADRIWTELGGHGVAAEFTGGAEGPTLMIRCELDALPIHEISDVSYRSHIDGKGHLCGHDGHMTIVIGVALALRSRPATGRVILLFQPAEETGAGAAAVINDPRWPELRPDFAFAYHNVPGQALGEIGLRRGISNCASRGMKIRFIGKTSHAAAPEDGISPVKPVAKLMQVLPDLGPGGAMGADFALTTLTHAQLGEASFGIAPGAAELRLTLRSQTDTRMDQLMQEAETHLKQALSEVEEVVGAIQSDVSWHDVFLATENSDEAVDIVKEAVSALGLASQDMAAPMRWSEDFGRFGLDGASAVMMFIGSGEAQPQLHNPNFDFPDALTPIGVSLLVTIVEQLLGRETEVYQSEVSKGGL